MGMQLPLSWVTPPPHLWWGGYSGSTQERGGNCRTKGRSVIFFFKENRCSPSYKALPLSYFYFYFIIIKKNISPPPPPPTPVKVGPHPHPGAQQSFHLLSKIEWIVGRSPTTHSSSSNIDWGCWAKALWRGGGGFATLSSLTDPTPCKTITRVVVVNIQHPFVRLRLTKGVDLVLS
nr:hypothetical protein [Morchella crassipes]